MAPFLRKSQAVETDGAPVFKTASAMVLFALFLAGTAVSSLRGESEALEAAGRVSVDTGELVVSFDKLPPAVCGRIVAGVISSAGPNDRVEWSCL